MSSQVFYLKWRSQTLAEIVGQPHVTRTLLNALKNGRVSHAYLFCGPRGTGKTSTSRILAKAVNCLNTGGRGEPCNECRICKAVTEGRALDIIEIDAASNTGVDSIRELIDKVNYAPNEARFKVYIIDEVHMLSTSASNALLKTLEEPPPHVIFILATTETHKVLPTILSRCQRFDFHRISQNDITGRLAQICEVENISLAPEGLKLIARSATGSLRDAINLLEQLTTYYGTEIELGQVQTTLGITGDWRAKELLKSIVGNDISTGIKTIQSVNNDGLDLKQFNREVVEYLRGLLLVKSNVSEAAEFTREDLAELKEMAAKTTMAGILKAVKTFGGLEFGFENYSTLPLEMALADCIITAEKDGMAAPVSKQPARATAPVPELPAVSKPKAVSPARISETVARPAAGEEMAPAVKPDLKDARPETAAARAQSPEPPQKEANPTPAQTQPLDDFENLKQNWKRLLEEAPADVKRTSALALLRSAKPRAVESNIVVISFRYAIHKENASKPDNQRVADKLVSDFLQRPCKVRCICEPEDNRLGQKLIKLGATVADMEEKQP